jgi:glycosyltransferase involved in cell wall biosynthesis
MVARTEPRRLLHVFSSFALGGPQIRFCTVANALGRCHRHVIVAMDGKFDCASRIAEGVCWEALPMTVAKGPGISVGNLGRFRKVLARVRPQLLLTYNWGAIEWALANRWWPLAPHLHFEDGFGADENPNAQLRRRVYLRRLALGGQTRIIVPSQTLWNVATRRWRFGENRILVVPNGVDCKRFGRPVDRTVWSRFGIEPDGLVIGTVTALRPEKNLGRLIAAFARLGTDFPGMLVVVGEGGERERLERLAEVNGVGSRIHFLGAVQCPEVLFGCFDIFAMSSDTEQMPIALLEAMASGLPVIATDVGDIAAVVAAENRPLIEGCRDDEALARGLALLASNPALRAELGARNRARAGAEFGLSRMLDRYRELFDTGRT